MTPTKSIRPVKRRAVVGWILFDWATQPYFTLVTTFVFAPYFATQLAANEAQGQALWGYATAAAGLTIAIFSPILGAIADAHGRRKPWILAFSVLLFAGSATLWFGAPGGHETIPLVLFAFVIATIGAEFATVFTNAMMPDLAKRGNLGRLSGYGWAVGYLGGLVSLVIVLGFMTASTKTGKTLLGFEPILGLDPHASEGDRASGPFSALWFALFSLPLFLFTPDIAPKASLGKAVRTGIETWRQTLMRLKDHREILAFLIANMAYKDGLTALFAFGGIYAAGILGWTTIEIGLFGILILVSGTFGAVIGGSLDDRVGAKTVISVALIILIMCCIGLVSVDRDYIFFVVKVAPPDPDRALFQSAPEIMYLILGGILGAISGPLQSASRTMLISLAPRDELTKFFGLFAMSGKITSFLAPLSVAAITSLSGSQRIGISIIIAFFVVGLLLLSRVRAAQSSD
ncbi:MAG: MFS transporter [Stappiaceae bacterium]